MTRRPPSLAAGCLAALAQLAADTRAHSPHDVVNELAISPQFAEDARVAVSFGSFGLGVALSDNGGASFAFENGGLSDLFVEEVALAADGTRFAGTLADGAGLGMLVERNVARANGWGMLVEGADLVVSANTIEDNTSGGLLLECSGADIDGNRVRRNAQVGILVSASAFVGTAPARASTCSPATRSRPMQATACASPRTPTCSAATASGTTSATAWTSRAAPRTASCWPTAR
ncbi:MAG: right-handed parallel beta-helix repeat-containing protein [Planctomycetes bacterium]|nr:right-handed parallel beta-helix repeat-containing protein [Planctomycetota bacterium]